jgi:hypothetical protein
MTSTPQQTLKQSEFGIPVARAACFSSPQAEAEALGRGRRAFACELEAGIVPHFIDAATGACTYVDPTTGEPVRHAVVICTNRPGGFGTSHVVRRQPPPSFALALDAKGQRVAVQSTTPLRRARLIYEYVPSIDGWRLMTYHPEAVSLTDAQTNLR